MSQVRFIADTHFGHKNMAIKRGFKDEYEHDEHIIKCWNSVVHKNDTTYILGDIAMENTKWYFRLDELNGRKKVILGNHDIMRHIPELLKHVESVGGIIRYSQKGTKKIFLTHCPVHPRELEYRIEINIHGHLHEHNVTRLSDPGWNEGIADVVEIKDDRYINVSMEQVGYVPQTLEQLLGNNK